MLSPKRRLLTYLLLAFCLTGCSGLISAQQPVFQSSLPLVAGQTIGQTFVAEFDGLAGVKFYLAPEASGSGSIILHLRTDPQSPTDLGVTAISLEEISAPGFYSFYFTPQSHSFHKYYYAFLEIQGQGSIQVGSASGDTYDNGALYQNGIPAEAQAAFQLAYSRRRAGLGLIQEMLTWAGLLLLGVFLFVLPGWGLLSLILPGWVERKWPEKLGLAAGLSLAIYPLLLLWTNLIGLHFGAGYAWIPPLVGMGMLIWKNRHWRRINLKIRISKISLPSVVFLVTLGIIFATRLWPVRMLEAPMWGDSVQHTVMAQLMMDHGGLFTSWEPYAPYRTLTVQYGFSSLVAVFAWVAGVSSTQATLIVGQILNALAIIALYPLATRLARGNAWAGIGTMLIAGLYSTMPAYYANWGRYAQLAGQVILPVALWLLWEAIEDNRPPNVARNSRPFRVALAALSMAGMTLTYYRMPFYYGTFCLALLVGWGIPIWRSERARWLRGIGVLMLVGISAVLLVLPWGLRQFGGHLADTVEIGISQGSAWERVTSDYRGWRDLFSYVSEPVLALGILGVAWALARKRWQVAALVLWVGLLSSIVALSLVRLPGANMMQSFAVLIALYIPVGFSAGWLIGEAAEAVINRWQPFGKIAIVVFFLAAVAWGVWKQRAIVAPKYFAMVTQPDRRAMDWIRKHTPEDSRFLVEGFAIYNGTMIVGSDAGWWIPLLARRANTMPPQYALFNEIPTQAGYTQSLVNLINNLQLFFPPSPEGLKQLCDLGITHAYIGQDQGNVSTSGNTQLFSPQALSASEAFEMIYHQDRVYIFLLKPEVCR